MNVNVRLSEAALFLLLTFSSTFALGFQAGKSYAEQTMHQPGSGGVVNTR